MNMNAVQPRTLLAIAVAVALSACATPTTYERPSVQVPSVWQQGASGSHTGDHEGGHTVVQTAISPWWTALQDLQLTQLIEDALARNNDLAQAAI